MPSRAWFAFLWATCAAAQSIQGTVLNAATGSGIPGVQVELLWSGEPAYNSTTDAQGRFVFDHVKEGAYTASYTAEGYEWVGPLRTPPEPRLYRATAGNTVEIVAHMMPMGHLSGRVLDPAGKPVPKAVVEVHGPGIQMNLPADEQGRFDFHKLGFPGTYTLSAIPPAGFPAPEHMPDDDRVLAWTRTFYPGVTDPGGAATIFLSPGGSVDNLDLKLKAVPAHAVRGVLLQPGGKPAADVEVTLSSAKGLFKAKTFADGAFEFLAADGDWRLSAEAQASFLNAKLRASQFVTIAGRDREVKLSLDPPITVTLRAVAETSPGTPAPKFLPRPAMLAAVDASGLALLGDRVLAQPQAEGSFALSGVYPRSYEVGGIAPPGYYFDSVRLGGTALPGRVVELTAGAVVTLVYRADGATLRGQVENCGGGGVLLMPRDTSRRYFDENGRASCDASGRYEFLAVRPGSYYVLAVAKTESNFLWAAEWEDAMTNQATGVTLHANETVSLDLRAVTGLM
jgi:hypothetical protein